ncbi:hypothetical protein BVI434_150035 [Burkholderia vietnamiensis]|nr:hypothetical protein BVI434_150035 [Burkholderia vietnamiensis]
MTATLVPRGTMTVSGSLIATSDDENGRKRPAAISAARSRAAARRHRSGGISDLQMGWDDSKEGAPIYILVKTNVILNIR